MIFQEFKSCFKNHSSKHFPRFLILLFTFVSYVFHLLLHFIFLYFWKRLTGFRYNKKFHVTNQKKKKNQAHSIHPPSPQLYSIARRQTNTSEGENLRGHNGTFPLSLSLPDIRLHRYRASVQSDYAKHQNR